MSVGKVKKFFLPCSPAELCNIFETEFYSSTWSVHLGFVRWESKAWHSCAEDIKGKAHSKSSLGISSMLQACDLSFYGSFGYLHFGAVTV